MSVISEIKKIGVEKIMKKRNYILDKPHKKIWGLNQMKIGETVCGVPKAYHYKNKNSNEFVVIDLDYGYAVCKIFFLIFSFPNQKILNSKFHNSFELVRFYREANGIPVDDNISQLHDIDWQKIIDWLNQLQTLKIQVISKSMNGFNNLRFEGFTDTNLSEFVDFDKWIL